METIVVDDDELAWRSDRETLFGNFEPLNHNSIPAFRGGKELLLNVSRDEHFMVWMRLAAHAGATATDRLSPLLCLVLLLFVIAVEL